LRGGWWLDRAVGGLFAGTPGPTDDYWYNPVGTVSTAGLKITPDGAQKVSAFYRGVDLLSTALAMLPLHVYRRLEGDDGAEVAKDQPQYDLLHRKPNGWQDSFQWRRQAMRHLIMRGNAYSRIIPGARGAVDQLWPMSPDLVKPEQMPNGRIVYRERQKDGTSRTYVQEEILHLRGVSDDGIEGIGVVQWAKDSLGLALATESYAARLFSQGSLYGTVLTLPTKPDDEQRAAYRQSLQESTSGVGNAHGVLVTWSGATVTRNGLTGEETQFIDSRKFSIDDISRWLGLPPHMIGSLERSTNNNIEQQGQEFVTYSLGPWLTLVESALNDQVVLEPDTYFAEFVRDALVRGDIAARWASYHTAVTDGVVTRNEVRRKENMAALDGLDEPLTPAHIVGKPSPGDQAPPEPAAPEPVKPPKAEAIAQASAARVLRKEVTAVQKMAVRYANDGEAFAVAVTEFYAKHVQLVSETLQMPEPQAREYCASQAGQALGVGWLQALDLWQSESYAAGLAALALEDAA
jgi:HK97 family phage portal protein